MKKIFLKTLCMFLSGTISAQQNQLDNYNLQRQNISKQGLKFLSGYAAVNIIYGSIASSKYDGDKKYFHQMNAVWNGVTLGIVGLGLLTQKKEGELTLAQSIKKQHNIEKLFLLNAGLDVAYIATGAYLKQRANSTVKNPERLSGFGKSIMLQGAFLLLFDGVLYSLHNHHGKKLTKILETVGFTSAQQNNITLKIML
jgi:hypothetical protein